MVTIEPIAEPEQGRMRVVVSGGQIGSTLYLFRRDSTGVAVVRDTAAGGVAFPPTGPPVATNLIGNGDLADLDGSGRIAGLVSGTLARVTRDTLHPVAGGAGWSARIRWGVVRYPALNRYPSTAVFPKEP